MKCKRTKRPGQANRGEPNLRFVGFTGKKSAVASFALENHEPGCCRVVDFLNVPIGTMPTTKSGLRRTRALALRRLQKVLAGEGL